MELESDTEGWGKCGSLCTGKKASVSFVFHYTESERRSHTPSVDIISNADTRHSQYDIKLHSQILTGNSMGLIAWASTMLPSPHQATATSATCNKKSSSSTGKNPYQLLQGILFPGIIRSGFLIQSVVTHVLSKKGKRIATNNIC